MKIGLVNMSKEPALQAPGLFATIALALEIQLSAHVGPTWQAEGVPVAYYDSLDDVPADTSPLIVFDNADQAQALGYHSVDTRGKAFGRAFWHPIAEHGGSPTHGAMSLSATLSHEAIEMVLNPYVNFWADMPDGKMQEAMEGSDRVEADSYDIEVEDAHHKGHFVKISVSNFLSPRAFRDGPGPYDFLELMKEPWEVRPGGYCIRRNIETGETFNVWGEHYLPWRKELKALSPRMKHRHADRQTSRSTQLSHLLPGLSPATAALLVTAHESGVLDSTIEYSHLSTALTEAGQDPTQASGE